MKLTIKKKENILKKNKLFVYQTYFVYVQSPTPFFKYIRNLFRNNKFVFLGSRFGIDTLFPECV